MQVFATKWPDIGVRARLIEVLSECRLSQKENLGTLACCVRLMQVSLHVFSIRTLLMEV